MQMKKYLRVLLSSLVVFSSSAFSATNLNNSNADTVSLRTQCGTSQDCAENMNDLLTWIWNTRNPDALNPLLVNIGPGTFRIADASGSGMMFCDGDGHVTFRGAGRSTTTLMGPGLPIKLDGLAESAAMKIRNCSQLSFEDMTIKADLFVDEAAYAVGWEGGGSSTWSNIELIASYYPWVDKCTNSGEVGTHTWFGSTFISNGSGVLQVAYRSDCGISEIHGSNLFTTKTVLGNTNWSMLGVEATAKGQVALYGSSVRVIVPATAASGIVFSNLEAPQGLPIYGQGGLLAINGGMIHMHGGIISVRHERNDVTSSVFGARTIGTDSMIHTPDTAFGMKASGSGVIERIKMSGGMVSAPFQWPQSINPPNIISVTGADTFIETDCSLTGSCDNVPSTQQEPHLMIYNSFCVLGGPWFDSTMKQCRM